jgi:hypothetical protein
LPLPSVFAALARDALRLDSLPSDLRWQSADYRREQKLCFPHLKSLEG